MQIENVPAIEVLLNLSFLQSRSTVGVTISERINANANPPITAMASGCSISEPAPISQNERYHS